MPRPRSDLGSRLRALRRTVDLSSRRFGIEMEFTGRERLRFYADRIDHALQQEAEKVEGSDPALAARYRRHAGRVCARDSYFHSAGYSWDVKIDGSCGNELASPILTAEDWPVVEVICKALRESGAQVNQHCGLHVHHEARDLRQSHIRNLIRLWAAFDGPMHEALPPSRRVNSYAERLLGLANSGSSHWYYTNGSHARYTDADAPDLANVIRNYGRYQSLNLTAWAIHGRIEFRAHHGTLNAAKIRAWLTMTQRFVDTAAAGRPQRIIAGARGSQAAALARVSRVIGAPLYRTLLNWLRRRNPTWLQQVTTQAAVAAA